MSRYSRAAGTRGKRTAIPSRASKPINLLLFFAAGLFAYGIHELQEAGLVPIIVEHIYDINGVLDESSTLGAFLKALLGYNGNPSLLETLSYLGYLAVVGVLIWRGWRRPVRSDRSQAVQPA